jgi:hypothetical protein
MCILEPVGRLSVGQGPLNFLLSFHLSLGLSICADKASSLAAQHKKMYVPSLFLTTRPDSVMSQQQMFQW